MEKNMVYPWLEEKKQQTRMQKTAAASRNYATTPISERYMQPTGAGTDGVVQPQKPTDMFQTVAGPRMVHEGEGMVHNQDGSVTVVPQSKLAAMEKQYNIQGYVDGGILPPLKRDRVDPAKPAGTRTIDINNNLPTMAEPKIAAPVFAPTAGTTEINNTLPSLTPTTPAINPATPLFAPAAGATKMNTLNPVTPAIKPLAPVIAPAAKPAGATPTPEPVTTPSTEDIARTTGMQGLTDIATKGSPAAMAASQKAVDDLKATQAVESRAALQSGAQTGVNKDVMASRQAQLAAQQGATLGETESAGALAQATARENAFKELASQGLSGQQYETAKEQFKQTFGLSEAQFNESKSEFDKQFANTVSQQGVAQSNWQQEFNQTVKQTDVEQSNWQKTFDLTIANSADQKSAAEYTAAIARGDVTAATAAWQKMYPGSTPDMTQVQADIAGKKRDTVYADISKYAAIPGMDAKEAVDTLISNGEATEADRSMLEKVFDGSKTAANPVSQLTASLNDPSVLSDDIVNSMFADDPDMSGKTTAEKRASIVKTAVTALIDPNGTLTPKTGADKVLADVADVKKEAEAKESAWLGADGTKYDDTNTNPSQKSMFAEGGNVWTGDGQTQALTPGQKITLKATSGGFGVQGTTRTIPNGNYTAATIGNQKMLISEDGTKYYPTQRFAEANKTISDRYTFNNAGGYYTKNS
jgi:hypothetical protein